MCAHTSRAPRSKQAVFTKPLSEFREMYYIVHVRVDPSEILSQVRNQQECTEVEKPCTALTDESSPLFISGVTCEEKTKQECKKG